jgi:FixJ family two-component response regulator
VSQIQQLIMNLVINASEALEGGEGIRLILMDLTMPRMGGEETYRELRRRGFRTPVILSSGFHEEMALRHFRGQGLAGFLQKPYRYNTIMKMLREALGGSPKA